MTDREVSEALLLKKLDVSRETLERLALYEALLRRWNRRINLVSAKSLEAIWSRHFVDSLGLAHHDIAPALDVGGRWVDLGSGAGLPILPVAIAFNDMGRDAEWIAVESDARKSAFLREAARETGVALDVRIERAERLSPLEATVISARALASLKDLMPLVRRHSRADGQALLLKGHRVDAELTEASRTWHIKYQNQQHPFSRDGYILRVLSIDRADLRG